MIPLRTAAKICQRCGATLGAALPMAEHRRRLDSHDDDDQDNDDEDTEDPALVRAALEGEDEDEDEAGAGETANRPRAAGKTK